MKLIVGKHGTRLFLPPGKGKTATVLKAFSVLRDMDLVDCMLVLAPLRVITTSWPGQLEKWEDFEHLSYVIVHGGKTERQWAMNQNVDVYLMNVEGLLSSEWKATKKGSHYVLNKFALDWLKSKRVMLVVDESTKFKNSDSQRFKNLRRLLPYFNRRVIMTGTPKPNKVEDLFSQCYITDDGEDLGQFVTHFRNRYMEVDFQGELRAQHGALERIAKKIAHCTLQIEDDEAIPTETVDIWVDMSPEVKRVHDELKEHLITEIEGKTIITPSANSLIIKMRQIAQGALYEGEGYLNIHELKLDVLENLLEEINGEPVFLLYQFRFDMERISKRLGYEVPYVGGGVSAALGAARCAAFSSGSVPLLGGQPQSVAHGVDGLQDNCRNIIWFGINFSWEDYYQAVRRVARQGSKFESVMIYRILLNCPIEKAMLKSVESKRRDEESFLKYLREAIHENN